MPAKRQRTMAKGYTFLPDVATADVCFEATGRTLAELLANAGLATEEVMVDLATVKPKVTRKIRLANAEVDKLLFDFLEELIYTKDKDLLLFSRFGLKIEEKGGKHVLTGTMRGETIDTKRHRLMTDVKAVTLHMFKVERAASGWKARVVLDI